MKERIRRRLCWWGGERQELELDIFNDNYGTSNIIRSYTLVHKVASHGNAQSVNAFLNVPSAALVPVTALLRCNHHTCHDATQVECINRIAPQFPRLVADVSA